MNSLKRLRQIIYVLVLIWAGISIAGCGQNSVNSLNPTGAETDPESSINLPTTTPTKSENRAPVLNLRSQELAIGPGGEVNLTAEAMDPDGDQIEFNWDSSSGVLTRTNGSQATWQAPESSVVASITCTVRDGNGGETQATANIEVIGNATYRLTVTADRSALITSRMSQVPGALYIPLVGAQVITDAGHVGITDAEGAVEFPIVQAGKVATYSNVRVQYSDWDIEYIATLNPGSANKIIDSINFAPGFDGVTIAVGRGDSFVIKRGAVQVKAIENSAGALKPLAEVTVDVGSKQAISSIANGLALLSSPVVGNGEVNLRLAKTGYQTINGYKIPVAIDGLTLIKAKLEKDGFIPATEATLAWTRPYNQERNFPVTGPFVFGFGQAMETDTLFDDMAIMIQNKDQGSLVTLDGALIKQKFRIEWEGMTTVKLYPKQVLDAQTRYSIMISKWNARAADGRILKTYNGMFGEFVTDIDPTPGIISMSPNNGDVDVGRTGPFIVRFNREIQADSLFDDLEIEISSLESGATMTIDGQNLRSYFSITWKDGNSVLELVPYKMLAPHHKYLIKLKSSAIKSVSGKLISDIDNLWGQFTTGGL